MLQSYELKTEIGDMIAVADEKYLYFLDFKEDSKADHKLKILKLKLKRPIVRGKNDLIDSIDYELKEYFKGFLKEFKTPVAFFGTPFQIDVWKALQTIPYGKTVSYADLATSVGKPSAFRAAANANGRNLLPIIVPCHRVINSDGKQGGYSSGLKRKEWLLHHEQSI